MTVSTLPPKLRTSARFVACQTLVSLAKERIPVGHVFEKVLRDSILTEKDRQLARNIIYGVLRNQESLDRMLQYLCSQPLKKLKPFIHQALRVGLYQIIYLDRIPDSAAVNESVKAVQAAKLPKRLHGFVNGVLRNSIRKRDELLSLLQNPKETILNHPRWLTQRWQDKFGREGMEAICQQNNSQAPLTLQVNSCKSQRNDLLELLHDTDVQAEKCPYSKTGIILSDFHGRVELLPGYDDGLFQVQDQGAQLLGQLFLPMQSEGRYLDACAGAGGKTSLLIQLGDAVEATVSAVEPDSGRRSKFLTNMRRLHPELDVPLFAGTLEDFARRSGEKFNGILLDAPCSGTGVTGRHPDIRWNRREEDLPEYQQTQLALLHSAAGLLAPGGILLYATCSLEEEENEQVIETFLAENSDFTLQDCREQFPADSVSLFRQEFFAPLPQRGMDGFFGARLQFKN